MSTLKIFIIVVFFPSITSNPTSSPQDYSGRLQRVIETPDIFYLKHNETNWGEDEVIDGCSNPKIICSTIPCIQKSHGVLYRNKTYVLTTQSLNLVKEAVRAHLINVIQPFVLLTAEENQKGSIEDFFFELDITNLVIFIIKDGEKDGGLVRKPKPSGIPRSFKAVVLNHLLPTPLLANVRSPKPGVLVKPLVVICEHLRLDLQFIFLPVQEQIKFTQERYVVSNFSSKDSDTYLTALKKPHTAYDSMEYTGDFLTLECRYIVPIPLKLATFYVLLKILSWQVWLLVVGVFFLVVGLLWAVAKMEQQKPFDDVWMCFMLIFASSLNMGSKIWNDSKVLSLLFFSYGLYIMHLSNVYQGRLNSYLILPILPKGIRSDEDLAASDLPILSVPFIIDCLREIDPVEYPLAGKLLSKTRATVLTVTQRKNMIMNYRNISSSDVVLFEGSEYQKLGTVKSNYLPVTLAHFQMRKGHPHFKKIDETLRRLVEGGFHLKWVAEMAQITFLDSEDGDVPLSFVHMEGAFAILSFGCAFAGVVFALEILWVLGSGWLRPRTLEL